MPFIYALYICVGLPVPPPYTTALVVLGEAADPLHPGRRTNNPNAPCPRATFAIDVARKVMDVALYLLISLNDIRQDIGFMTVRQTTTRTSTTGHGLRGQPESQSLS